MQFISSLAVQELGSIKKYMEATNSLNIFTPTQTRVEEVATPPKLNPPSLKEALHIVSPKLLPFALSLSGNMSDAEDLMPGYFP